MAGATLARLIDDLGIGVLELVAAPKGLDVEVGKPLVHDPVVDEPVEPGDVVLAVGVEPGRREARQLVEAAGRGGAAAVILRSRVLLPEDLIEAAESAGVALLAVPAAMAWGQLHTLVRTSAATAGTDGEQRVGDLFALANAVAAMVGGPTTIEDPQSTVLAFSSLDEPIDEPRRQTILGRRVPDVWIARLQDEGVFKRLWASTDVVHYDDPADPALQPRIAIAVRAGGEILGSIWVAEGSKPLGPDAEQALREAADIAGLHMIRHRMTDDVVRRRREDMLRSLLEGRVPAHIAGPPLGIDLSSPCTVIAFAIGARDAGETLLKAERAVDLVSLYGEAFRRQASCVAMGATVYLLVPDDHEPRRLMALASDVIERTEGALRLPMRAGIGSTVARLDDVATSRREADQVLLVSDESVTHVDVVRSRTVLLELSELAHGQSQLRAGPLAALRAHDAAKGTFYVGTLRAWLESFGDVPSAAASINVHPNTFRYRLRRLVELSGIDLDDPDERLVATLQLRLAP